MMINLYDNTFSLVIMGVMSTNDNRSNESSYYDQKEKFMMRDFPKVLYIMGTGRSGTTILGAMLAWEVLPLQPPFTIIHAVY